MSTEPTETDPLIHAPWTPEQVAALNLYQQAGAMHPFTCGALHASGRSPVLDATHTGWICPDPACEYTQDWAWAFMIAVAPPATDLRDRIRRAICEAEGFAWDDGLEPDEYGEVADAVLAVFPAPADQAAEAEVWTVGREDGPIYGHFAIEVDAKLAAIECWREAETPGVKFVYSWQQDGSWLELLADGNCTGVLVSRDDVHGAAPTPPADRAAVLREAADIAAEWMSDCQYCAVELEVANYLRRLADEAQQPASTAPLAANLPLVQGRCPACHRASLFLGDGGYVTCSQVHCPEPDAATTALERPADRGTAAVIDETAATIQAEGAQR